MKTLTVTLVHTEDGTLDYAGSLEACEIALDKHCAESAESAEQIGTAMDAVFAKSPGARFNVDYLINETLRSLSVTPESFKTWDAKAREYLKDNSQGKAEDGIEARPDSKFIVRRGKGVGGVTLRT